jgi:hypothetical protein
VFDAPLVCDFAVHILTHTCGTFRCGILFLPRTMSSVTEGAEVAEMFYLQYTFLILTCPGLIQAQKKAE